MAKINTGKTDGRELIGADGVRCQTGRSAGVEAAEGDDAMRKMINDLGVGLEMASGRSGGSANPSALGHPLKGPLDETSQSGVWSHLPRA